MGWRGHLLLHSQCTTPSRPRPGRGRAAPRALSYSLLQLPTMHHAGQWRRQTTRGITGRPLWGCSELHGAHPRHFRSRRLHPCSAPQSGLRGALPLPRTEHKGCHRTRRNLHHVLHKQCPHLQQSVHLLLPLCCPGSANGASFHLFCSCLDRLGGASALGGSQGVHTEGH